MKRLACLLCVAVALAASPQTARAQVDVDLDPPVYLGTRDLRFRFSVDPCYAHAANAYYTYYLRFLDAEWEKIGEWIVLDELVQECTGLEYTASVPPNTERAEILVEMRRVRSSQGPPHYSSRVWTRPVIYTCPNTTCVDGIVDGECRWDHCLGTLALTPVTQVAPVTAAPEYVFNSNLAGAITYSAECPAGGPAATAAPPADTLVAFDTAVEGPFSGCRLTVTTRGEDFETLTLDDFVIDTTPPALTAFTRRTAEPRPPFQPLLFRAAFSEAVANVDPADFAVAGWPSATVAAVAQVAPDSWDVTVSGGDPDDLGAAVGLDLAPGQDVADLAGNSLSDGEPALDEAYRLFDLLVAPAVGPPAALLLALLLAAVALALLHRRAG